MDTNYLKLIRKVTLFRKQYHTYMAERISELNLSYSEFSFLKELINGDGVTQESIVKHVCIDKAATSRTVKILEQKNLIKREKNELDKRSLLIFLTDEGKELIPILNKILSDWQKMIEDSMGTENIQNLDKLLNMLNEAHL